MTNNQGKKKSTDTASVSPDIGFSKDFRHYYKYVQKPKETMSTELEKCDNDSTWIFAKETEIIKKEPNDTRVKEYKNCSENLLEKLSQKLKIEKGRISELEDRSMEITISEEHRNKIKVKRTRTSKACQITFSTPIYV